jgi:hypothetical protein
MLVPFCQRRLWKPHVYRPGLTVPIAKPNPSAFVICFAIVTSSVRSLGTLPASPASFITFVLR